MVQTKDIEVSTAISNYRCSKWTKYKITGVICPKALVRQFQDIQNDTKLSWCKLYMSMLITFLTVLSHHSWDLKLWHCQEHDVNSQNNPWFKTHKKKGRMYILLFWPDLTNLPCSLEKCMYTFFTIPIPYFDSFIIWSRDYESRIWWESSAPHPIHVFIQRKLELLSVCGPHLHQSNTSHV